MNELNSIMSGTCETPCDSKPTSCDIATTLNDRLAAKKRRLETELSETNAALQALQDHPDVAKVLTLVGKAMSGHF